MSKQRTLQIDVKGAVEGQENLIEMVLSVDGRDCRIYTSKANYEALIFDGVFIRDGESRDSANILNTTNVFVER